ncbi:bromodomain-containing protein 3-like [Drosophila madeirensis]|uniref:Bromodomain-containing protein 3-like n=1 Tax=Drosophila madeirensis TaxID=30013 RepID=A0AAU9FZR5_DROMD
MDSDNSDNSDYSDDSDGTCVNLRLESCVQPSVTPKPSNFGQYTNKMHFFNKYILMDLYENEYAVHFREPVDMEVVQAPNYYAIVAQPMDMGTIMQRLKNHFYHHVGEAVSDFLLMLHNCFQYNLRGTMVYERGCFLEKFFMERLYTLPKGPEYPHVEEPKNFRKTRMVAPRPYTTTPLRPPAATARPTRRAPTRSLRPRIATTQPLQLQPQLQPQLQLQPQPVPGRVLTRVRPTAGPKPSNLGKYSNKLNCFEIAVLEVAAKRDFGQDFLEPVDAVKLGVPQYYMTIVKPMDMQTIKRRLRNNFYHHFGEAVSDVMLILHNCFKFNQPDEPVYKNGQLLEEFFWKELKQMPTGPEMPTLRSQ